MNYLDKYRGNGVGRMSVYDILSLDHNDQTQWEQIIRPNYVAEANGAKISEVKIGGNTFTNYGDFQFTWEKSYVKSPERSADGSIGNLNSYATFVTPHLIMNFGIMSIDDYRRIMRLDLESNEFVVECYDPIYNNKFKGKMYFGTPQMAKLFKLAKIRFNGEEWEEFIELVGVQEYTVELIGTNADLDLVSVSYVVNPPSGETPTVQNGGEPDVYKGEEVIVGTSTNIPTETFSGQYKFKEWKDAQGVVYTNGYAYTINSPLVLYAQWEATSNKTLTYNYGLADPQINNSSYQYVTNKTVVKGQSIGNLPTFANPKVVAKNLQGEDEEFEPYYDGKWYKIPVRPETQNESGLVVTDGMPYWSDFDATIHLLFLTNEYTVTMYVGEEQYQMAHTKYKETIPFPYLVREGKKFDGWYFRDDYKATSKITFSSMPPYSFNAFARWIDE